MSRRRVIGAREILPDPKYGSEMLAKFVNMVMSDGKKSVAETIIYGALNQISGKGHSDPMEVLDKALDTVRPMVEDEWRRAEAERLREEQYRAMLANFQVVLPDEVAE